MTRDEWERADRMNRWEEYQKALAENERLRKENEGLHRCLKQIVLLAQPLSGGWS